MNVSFAKHFGNLWSDGGRSVDFLSHSHHPRYVRSLTTRLAALVAVIALTMGSWVQCAGWQRTAAERMACCAHNGRCPMRHSTVPDVPIGNAIVTQAQADSCCALSERSPSTPSNSSYFATFTLVVLSTLVSVPPPDAAPVHDAWRTFIPVSVSTIPRHLLLSVFLV
jgi:hypothetical protein